MQEYLRPLIVQRQIQPSDDILSMFVAAQRRHRQRGGNPRQLRASAVRRP
jgi:cytochrome P450